ncbi:MAG TPA: hypothetical protein DIU00_09985 [Phycisphaerales bacterium]|nr:hypothetical protein [Phycisphaerales bacterium]
MVALALATQASTSYASIMSVANEGTWQTTMGSWNTADFEDFWGPVNTQYAGVTFSGFNGGSPYTTTAFPYGGLNSVFTVVTMNAGGGGWTATFATPVQGFAFWSNDVQFSGSTISIWDSQSNLLGTYDLMNSGSGHRPYFYGFNGFVSNAFDIAKVEVAIDITDAIWFDNFQYSPVPVPGAVILGSIGLAYSGLRLRRRKEL